MRRGSLQLVRKARKGEDEKATSHSYEVLHPDGGARETELLVGAGRRSGGRKGRRESED